VKSWLFAAVLLLAAACGSAVPHSEIVAAAAGRTVSDGVVAGSGGGGSSALNGLSGGSSTGTGAASGAPASGGGVSSGGVDASGGASGGGALTGGTGDVTGSDAGTSGATGSSGATSGPAAGSAPAGGATAVNPDLSTVVLGTIGSYSGVLGAIFPGGAAAMEAWAQYANAHGGLDGHAVKVVSGDDGGDPAQALSLAKEMVESDGAIGFVGTMVPLSFSGIQPYLDQKGIPLIGGDVTLPAWITDPDIFPQGTDVASISAAAVDLITAGGLDKLAVLYCGESPSCKQLAVGAEADPPPGVKVVYTAEISIVQTDFTTECLQAKSEGAQAIFVAADSNTVLRVGGSCAQQQYHPRYGTASIAVGPSLATDPNMNGLVAPVNNAPWFLSDTPGTHEFAEAMAQYAPGAPLAATAVSMFASGVLVQEATTHLSAHPTAAELLGDMDALKNATADGLSPSLSFSPGRGSGPIPCYFVVAVANQQWTAPDGANPVCPS
jgi:branched-chain amino acid transport system substrate-binding protein